MIGPETPGSPDYGRLKHLNAKVREIKPICPHCGVSHSISKYQGVKCIALRTEQLAAEPKKDRVAACDRIIANLPRIQPLPPPDRVR